jgi:hypothetical protein
LAASLRMRLDDLGVLPNSWHTRIQPLRNLRCCEPLDQHRRSDLKPEHCQP